MALFRCCEIFEFIADNLCALAVASKDQIGAWAVCDELCEKNVDVFEPFVDALHVFTCVSESAITDWDCRIIDSYTLRSGDLFLDNVLDVCYGAPIAAGVIFGLAGASDAYKLELGAGDWAWGGARVG